MCSCAIFYNIFNKLSCLLMSYFGCGCSYYYWAFGIFWNEVCFTWNIPQIFCQVKEWVCWLCCNWEDLIMGVWFKVYRVAIRHRFLYVDILYTAVLEGFLLLKTFEWIVRRMNVYRKLCVKNDFTFNLFWETAFLNKGRVAFL